MCAIARNNPARRAAAAKYNGRPGPTDFNQFGLRSNSRHIAGGAGDIVVPGISAASVGRFGVWLRAGGVGFYPSGSFTHVDDGQLRTWRG